MLIVKPIITEKSIKLAEESGQYTFQVLGSANKTEAAKEIEQVFDVKVGSVRVHNRLGKKVRFGANRKPGVKPDIKIMIFKLTKGNIDLFRS